MFDVTAIGELLIDFTPAGLSGQNHPLFEQNPGGAPANVLAGLSRLGLQTAFIGKVGDDRFGTSLRLVLEQAGIDVQGLHMTSQCHTTLAFVHLDEHGDRSFSFYRNPGADILLQPWEVPLSLVEGCRIFHFGSVSMTTDPVREATRTAVRHARASGCLISFDPNLRPALWASDDEARSVIRSMLPETDVLKISEEELFFLTCKQDLAAGAAELQQQNSIQLILVTLGPRGAYARTEHHEAMHPAYAVRTIDTTGAGDAFTGGILYHLIQTGCQPGIWTSDDLYRALMFANAMGSLATTRKGAMPAMPDLSAIEDCMRHVPLLA